jgi:DNA-binding LytR/AlgR family response regulator
MQERTSEVIIRNSISEIENQLDEVPFFMRIHRAFIVNLEKVSSKKGNSLGYQLKLKGSNIILPVSRQNTQKFDQLIRRFLLSVYH